VHAERLLVTVSLLRTTHDNDDDDHDGDRTAEINYVQYYRKYCNFEHCVNLS